ncbi:MAG: FixH family protein [Alphaproteobacteria bacterium]|nr:FixH family protein [Alphaproteobacteria bacterium]
MTQEWTGRHTLVALIGTFAVVLGVNFYFIYQAEATYPGEDVQQPYLQGIHYNQIIAEREAQAALGWHATIGAGRDAKGDAVITVTIADKAGAPVAHEAISGLLRHPMNEQLDRPIAFVARGDGTYVGRVSGVGAGRWDFEVERSTAKEAPFTADRLVWLR